MASGEFEVTGTVGCARSNAAKGIVRIENGEWRMENDLFELTLEETQSLRSQFVTLNDSQKQRSVPLGRLKRND